MAGFCRSSHALQHQLRSVGTTVDEFLLLLQLPADADAPTAPIVVSVPPALITHLRLSKQVLDSCSYGEHNLAVRVKDVKFD